MSSAECCADTVGGGLSRRPDVDDVRRTGFAAIRMGSPSRMSELASATRLPSADVRAIVEELLEAGLATVDGVMDADPVVDGVDGLTTHATRHRLSLGGRGLHTWCGFDTIGIPAALGVDATIATDCPSCAAAIRLAIVGGEAPSTPVVGWWPWRAEGPINKTFCPTASLFCDPDHLAAWRAETEVAGEAVAAAELAVRGRATWALFADKTSGA